MAHKVAESNATPQIEADAGKSSSSSSIPRPIFATLMLTVFLDFLGFSMILPYLFFLTQGMGASTFAYGLIIASYSIEQFLFAPILGRLSDMHGRKRVLILTLLGSATSYFVFGLSNVLWLLFLSRMLAGAFSGTYPVVQAYVADHTDKESRLRQLGMLAAAYGLGYVLGPVIGGVMSQEFGYAVPSFFVCAVALGNALISYFRLPDSRAARPVRRGDSSFLSSLSRPFGSRQMVYALLMNFTSTIAFVFLLVVLPPWLAVVFSFGPLQTGLILFYAGLIAIGTVALVIPRLSRSLSASSIVTIGLAVISISYVLLGLVDHASLETFLFGFVVAGLLSFGFSLVGPALNTLISLSASDGTQGGAFGFSQSTAGLARALAPGLATVLFSFGSSVGMVGFVFFAAAVINTLSLPLVLGLRRVCASEPHSIIPTSQLGIMSSSSDVEQRF